MTHDQDCDDDDDDQDCLVVVFLTTVTTAASFAKFVFFGTDLAMVSCLQVYASQPMVKSAGVRVETTAHLEKLAVFCQKVPD